MPVCLCSSREIHKNFWCCVPLISINCFGWSCTQRKLSSDNSKFAHFRYNWRPWWIYSMLIPISTPSLCISPNIIIFKLYPNDTPGFLSVGTWTHFTVQLAQFVKPSAVLIFRKISYFKPNAMCNSCCNCIVFLESLWILPNNALVTSADTDTTTQSMALISYFSVCTLRWVCRLWQSTRSFWR